MQRVYNILVNLFGESKQGGYDKSVTQYQFNCPYCADDKGYIDNKYNLEISFLIGKFHCWSCGHAGPISKLIKSKGSKTHYDEYFSIINDLKESRLYDINLFNENNIILENENLKLPNSFKKINLNFCKDKYLLSFLEKRNINQEIIDFYNIGYTTWDEEDWSWRNRVIIPSYDSYGDLNYFVGRTYRDNDKRGKYKNCNADKKKIIFQDSLTNFDADIVLVEGTIDALVGPNFVSLLGKFLIKDSELFKNLYNRSNANIIICLDSDTTIEETKRIYKTLNTGRLRNKIWYINLREDSKYKDFSEIFENEGKKGIIETLKKRKQFSELELML